MSDLTETLESLPPWVLPVGLVLVAVFATFGKSTGAGANGMVSVLTPIPADPNLTALAATESNNRLGAFQTLAGLYGTTDVSKIAAARDVSIATIQSDMSGTVTRAALEAARAADNVQQTLGLAAINGQVASAMDANATSRYATDSGVTVSLAAINSDYRARELAAQEAATATTVNAQTAVTLNAQNTNTAKALSHNNVVGNIIGTIGSVVSRLFGQ